MAEILIVEDEELINNLIKENLILAGHHCTQTYDGREAAELVKKEHFDLILLDLMLPGCSGYDILPLCGDVPVIILTARDGVYDKVKGLNGGAEDYIVKPFEMLELLVRMDKVLKRYGKEEAGEIYIKDVVIDEKKRIVRKSGEEIALQPMEFDCLMVFWKYRNRVMTRDQILNLLWGVDFEGESRTVDVHVANIRKKLDFFDVIITVPRVGYRMEVSE